MTVYSKINIIYRLQKWLDSVPGQTFLNYAYSWGASVVILGALFKLTHLPGANIMLYFGMGTEVIVFFISGFDRPFDKTSIGKEIPTHVGEDEEEEKEIESPLSIISPQSIIPSQSTTSPQSTISTESREASAPAPISSPQVVGISPEMEEATTKYVEELNNLTEMLGKVSEQSSRLSVDSEEMENLNRTLTGICKIYEMQLKSASAQIGTIDQINEQTKKMADQIAELNKIYARMIEAMSANVR